MELLLSEPVLFFWLALLGLAVGFMTGMFGVGGAFITTPIMMILFDFEPSMAVGCSMGFTLVNSALGLLRHRGTGNVEPKAMWTIGIASCVGTLTGVLFHYRLADALGDRFDLVVNGLFILILVPIGILVWLRSDKEGGGALISRFSVPPMVRLRQENLPTISLTILGIIGLAIGICKGMLGIGGGIILLPTLILAVGLVAHRAVVTSLGMVFMSSIVGTAMYAWRGDINVLIVAAMLVGSLLGVVLGARFCNITSPGRLKRLLAALVLGFSVFLAVKFWMGIATSPTEEVQGRNSEIGIQKTEIVQSLSVGSVEPWRGERRTG